jgi:hypothetical protein
VRAQLRTLPGRGRTFLLTQGMPFTSFPERIVPILSGTAGLALVAWCVGLLRRSDGFVSVGMLLWVISLLLAGLFGYVLYVQRHRETRRLTFSNDPSPSLVLEGPGEPLRIDLARTQVIASQVGQYIQLHLEEGSHQVLALFVSPEPRHIALLPGAHFRRRMRLSSRSRSPDARVGLRSPVGRSCWTC